MRDLLLVAVAFLFFMGTQAMSARVGYKRTNTSPPTVANYQAAKNDVIDCRVWVSSAPHYRTVLDWTVPAEFETYEGYFSMHGNLK